MKKSDRLTFFAKFSFFRRARNLSPLSSTDCVTICYSIFQDCSDKAHSAKWTLT